MFTVKFTDKTDPEIQFSSLKAAITHCRKKFVTAELEQNDGELIIDDPQHIYDPTICLAGELFENEDEILDKEGTLVFYIHES